MVAALETSLGVSWPVSYRKFLARFSNDRVTGMCHCPTLPGTYIEHFYGFPSDPEFDTDALDFDCLGIAPDAVAIGCDVFGGNSSCSLTKRRLEGSTFAMSRAEAVTSLTIQTRHHRGYRSTIFQVLMMQRTSLTRFKNLHYVADNFLRFVAGPKPSQE